MTRFNIYILLINESYGRCPNRPKETIKISTEIYAYIDCWLPDLMIEATSSMIVPKPLVIKLHIVSLEVLTRYLAI